VGGGHAWYWHVANFNFFYDFAIQTDIHHKTFRLSPACLGVVESLI